MSETVLVPIDGSPMSQHALEYAIESHPEATIVVFHVLDPAEPGYSTAADVDVRTEPPHGSAEWYDRATEEQRQLFEQAREQADNYGLELRTEDEIGDPAREIVDFVEQQEIDHVVIGSHGRSEPTRLLLGSTAELVVRRSPAPVTVVRADSVS